MFNNFEEKPHLHGRKFETPEKIIKICLKGQHNNNGSLLWYKEKDVETITIGMEINKC